MRGGEHFPAPQRAAPSGYTNIKTTFTLSFPSLLRITPMYFSPPPCTPYPSLYLLLPPPAPPVTSCPRQVTPRNVVTAAPASRLFSAIKVKRIGVKSYQRDELFRALGGAPNDSPGTNSSQPLFRLINGGHSLRSVWCFVSAANYEAAGVKVLPAHRGHQPSQGRPRQEEGARGRG